MFSLGLLLWLVGPWITDPAIHGQGRAVPSAVGGDVDSDGDRGDEASSLPLLPGSIEVDRIVAVVDDDPIFASDLERLITLGLVEREPDETDFELQRRVLDGLIDQRLHLHIVERYDFGPLPTAEIDRQVEALRRQSTHAGGLDAQLDALGMSEQTLRLLLGRQLQVLVYVEERLGPKVFVDPEEIRTYYHSTLTPAMVEQGVAVVPFDQVAEDIRSLLREERLNNEIDRWTQELRLEAEIIDLLDRAPRPLPPVVDRIDP